MTPRRAGVLFFLGLFAVQLAWIFSLPAFRGIDEHDHVYRADAVAHGQWVAPGDQAPESRGDLVSVRRSIVTAAGPVCSSLPYTDTYDCSAYGDDGDGRVLVASAAARYHPLFYAVIGTAARPFDGDGAVYAMRTATALIASALVGVALASWRRLSPSPWMPLAFVVVLTPTMTYSSAVAAPNGVEAAAALLTWVSLLRLLHAPTPLAELPRGPLVGATVGLALVTTLRSIGPMWALLILCACLISAEQTRAWLRAHTPPAMLAGGVLAGSVLASAAWTLSQGTNAPSQEGTSFPSPEASSVATQPLLWFFQSIAAFPTRGEQSLPIVYALVALVAFGLIATGLWRATTRIRLTMGAITAAVVLIPLALTAVSYEAIGFAWQGRYAWPLSMGVPLLAGLALSRATSPLAAPRLTTLGAVAGAGAATAVSQVWVMLQEVERGWARDGWQLVSPGVLVVLTMSGFVLIWLAHADTDAQRLAPATRRSSSSIPHDQAPSANLPR